MIRIGIIGTENSHAMAFAKYYNLPDPVTGKHPYDNIRVSALIGDDDNNAAIVKAVGLLQIAQEPEELLNQVDAVMITSRKGSDHFRYALPFVERGIPLFMDKPFTSDIHQARLLAERIAACGTKIMGGSGCKYAPALEEIRKKTEELRSAGEFASAAMSFRIMLDSPYNGIYFYAPHLVEMCLYAFGMDVKAVQAVQTGDSVIAIMQYEKDAVSLHFQGKSTTYGCTLFGNRRNYHFGIDISAIFQLEAGRFADMLLGKEEPMPLEALVKPVEIVDAIVRSLDSGRKIEL